MFCSRHPKTLGVGRRRPAGQKCLAFKILIPDFSVVEIIQSATIRFLEMWHLCHIILFKIYLLFLLAHILVRGSRNPTK